MTDTRTEVQPDGAAVALQRPGTDPASGNVVEPVVQPVTDSRCLPGRLDDAGVPLGLERAELGDHVGTSHAGDVSAIPPPVLLPH